MLLMSGKSLITKITHLTFFLRNIFFQKKNPFFRNCEYFFRMKYSPTDKIPLIFKSVYYNEILLNRIFRICLVTK